MLRVLLATDKTSTSALALRVMLGIVIFPHGTQKLLGWFNGFGYAGSMDYFTNTVGLPYFLGLLVILAESIGAVMLIAGFASRFAAFGIFSAMAGAMYVLRDNGFFMNWFGKQAGEGIEFFLLAMGMALVVMIMGGGRWSLDAWLARRYEREELLLS